MHIKCTITNKCDECYGTGIFTEPDGITRYTCNKCDGNGDYQGDIS